MAVTDADSLQLLKPNSIEQVSNVIARLRQSMMENKRGGILRNFRAYLAERFPLAITSVHALATAAFLVAIASTETNHLLTLAVAGSFFFFMLRMRVTDEFKDSHHDDQHYPNRPVQRGIITRKQLVVIGVAAFAAEISCALAAGWLTENITATSFYALIIGFSVLTRFEFFVPEFLERHFNLYFLSHQAIFILYPIWIFNLVKTEVTWQSIFLALAFILFMANMEIMRKYEIRINPAGEAVQDTYLTVWKSWAFWIMFSINALCAVLLFAATQLPIYALSALLTSILMLYLKKNTELTRAVVALSFLFQTGVCYLL